MLEQILKGGPLMVAIMACSLVSLAVVYDRWCAFRANRKIDTRSLRAKVLVHLRANEVDTAISACSATGGPLASVLLAGLRSYQQLKSSAAGGGGAVAAGIAEALITTAAGLLIALSAVIPQSVYNRWSDEIELEIQEANSEIVEFILTHH